MATYMQQQQIFLFIFLEGGLNFTKTDGLMNEKKTFQLHYITLQSCSFQMLYITFSTVLARFSEKIHNIYNIHLNIQLLRNGMYKICIFPHV